MIQILVAIAEQSIVFWIFCDTWNKRS